MILFAMVGLLIFAPLCSARADDKFSSPPAASSASVPNSNASDAPPSPAASPLICPIQLPDLAKRENLSSAMQIIILLTVLSLAPAILIMMTSFTRIIIVLSLLRQALGTQQLPPNQVLIGLSMFMTFLVMGPTWQQVNNDALAALHGRQHQSAGRAGQRPDSAPAVHDQADPQERKR